MSRNISSYEALRDNQVPQMIPNLQSRKVFDLRKDSNYRWWNFADNCFAIPVDNISLYSLIDKFSRASQN